MKRNDNETAEVVCLRRVLLSFGAEYREETRRLGDRLKKEGLDVGQAALDLMSLPDARQNPEWDGVLVLTDSPALARHLAGCGVLCFGCLSAGNMLRGHARDGQEPTGGRWFDGVPLVLENPGETDARFLEEWFLRAQGIPAVIASSGRLILREIASEDIAELARIAAQPEVRRYIRDESFAEESLRAYREKAYRLQGYGLWSVLLYGKVIGCCGFEPWTADREAQERREGRRIFARKLPKGKDGLCLELQYFLDSGYRRRGFGLRAGRAALAYAAVRLDTEDVRIVIAPDNAASEALARRLGFFSL